MVKKQEDDWMKATIDTHSAQQIRKYLDLCKDWLIQPNENEKEKHTFSNVPGESYDRKTGVIGVLDVDYQNIRMFQCALCKDDYDFGRHAVAYVANPFTRAQYMYICTACHGTLK